MNTQLYNSLVQARNFLVTVENHEADIENRKAMILITRADNFPIIETKDFNWGIFISLFFFVGPFALIYPLYIYLCNRKPRKKLKQIEKLRNSPEEIEKSKERMLESEHLKRELEVKKVEYKKYYTDNYWRYLGFLPDWTREFKTIKDVSHRIEYIDGLLNYVKGGARTLDDAMAYYAEELRERDARETAREKEEMLERRHKEKMAALNTIARNQEKTNDELDRLYKDTYLRRR